MELQAHQQRVIQERNDLNEKLTKLTEFINKSAMFMDLPMRDKDLLINQANAMVQYQQILNERIGRFIN